MVEQLNALRERVLLLEERHQNSRMRIARMEKLIGGIILGAAALYFRQQGLFV